MIGGLIAIIGFSLWLILRKKGQESTKQVQGSGIWVDRTIYPYPAYINQAKTILSQSTGTFSNNLINSGYSIVAVWSIICHETGWLSDNVPPGRSEYAVKTLNNILGIEAAGELKSFESINACLDFFQYIIEKKPDTFNLYRNAYAVRNYGDQFLIQLHAAGYNSKASWLRSVLEIYHSWYNQNYLP